MIFRIIALSFQLQFQLKIFDFFIRSFKKFDIFKVTSLIFWLSLILTSIFYILTTIYRVFDEAYFFYLGYKKKDVKNLKRYVEIYQSADPKKINQVKLKKRLCEKMEMVINNKINLNE
jgi:hypothetical protein